MYNETALESKPAAPKGRGVYFAGIIVCIVLLYIFNNLLDLYVLSVPDGSNVFKAIMNNAFTQVSIPFLSKSFISCLWAINLALCLGMMGNFTLLFYRPYWFHYLMQALLIALSILPVYIIYKTFPFILDSQSQAALVKHGLTALMIILGAGALFMLINSAASLVRAIRNFEYL